jgi:DNA-directed RNA polymerase subunit RPC12/RpoP
MMKMTTLVCWDCNQEIEIKFLDDIVNCPRCGETISREVPKYKPKRVCRKNKNKNKS